LLSALFLAVLLTGCGSEGTAKLSFALKARDLRAASLPMNFLDSLLRAPTVTSFKMRFIAAYLVPDVDATTQDNVGTPAMFYLNPQCQGAIDGCNLAGQGAAHEVTDYFDFTTAETANTAINAAATSVAAGTYKYVRLEFCQNSVSDDQVQFSIAGGATKTAKHGTCGITSHEADPPITIASGGSVTVTLSYDTSEFFTDSASDSGDGKCTSDGSPTNGFWCLSSINGSASDPTTGIVPSFTAN
jgi:hypothetical protein